MRFHLTTLYPLLPFFMLGVWEMETPKGWNYAYQKSVTVMDDDLTALSFLKSLYICIYGMYMHRMC